jgi:hypothetical protein
MPKAPNRKDSNVGANVDNCVPFFERDQPSTEVPVILFVVCVEINESGTSLQECNTGSTGSN